MTTKLFLDLEGTVIATWDDRVLCNIERVKSFLGDVKEVHIFSAAIWNDKDKRVFSDDIKPFLERVLDVSIMTWPSMEDVWKTTTWKGTRFENVQEMIALIGKKRMFEDWCFQKEQPETTCILVDDMFGNTTLIHDDLGIVVKTVDVNTL